MIGPFFNPSYTDTLLGTVSATSKTFSFVPLVDFDKVMDDKNLYAYFELTEQEMSYIDNAIKPMD